MLFKKGIWNVNANSGEMTTVLRDVVEGQESGTPESPQSEMIAWFAAHVHGLPLQLGMTNITFFLSKMWVRPTG